MYHNAKMMYLILHLTCVCFDTPLLYCNDVTNVMASIHMAGHITKLARLTGVLSMANFTATFLFHCSISKDY
jgi:hypothetical protein